MNEKSIINTWTSSSEVNASNIIEKYTKNGFEVVVENDNVTVYFNNSQINKPFYNLDQAIYWCEGRMFSDDVITKVDYDNISIEDSKKFECIGSVHFFDDNKLIEQSHYYKGKENTEYNTTYAHKNIK